MSFHVSVTYSVGVRLVGLDTPLLPDWKEKNPYEHPLPLCPTRLMHAHVACGTSVLVLLGRTFLVDDRKGTGFAGTQSLSGRERQGQEPQAP